jgi:hypothetical protein
MPARIKNKIIDNEIILILLCSFNSYMSRILDKFLADNNLLQKYVISKKACLELIS